MESVLVPVDGSDASAHAAAWAARYAAARGAELILLHVHAARGSETLALGALDAAQIEEAERRIAGPSFDKARAAIGHATAARTLVSIGDPAEEIVALARRERASLIVMGSRGLSPVRELLLGSVSEKVIRHAHCAVTVVR
ncbi:MAG: universal stress protein [Gammaproteobacteria bacterium]|jgi:nucleotide-binding universal stress UspA family protein|nr:universal stress protein [Gammaproteobacteria bacterium]MBK8993769.1 universal stress protein [Gammaproteobacteria bacterium]MBP6480163.1 universal stress protein [Pseudomonadales bacterium]MBP7909682.1 universal stress protein [Pseudomonadales bacterium]